MIWNDDEPGDEEDFEAYKTTKFHPPMKKRCTFSFFMEDGDTVSPDKKKKGKKNMSKIRGKAAQKADAARKWQQNRFANVSLTTENDGGSKSTNLTESQAMTAAIRNMAGTRRVNHTRRRRSTTKKKIASRRTSLVEKQIARKAGKVNEQVLRKEDAQRIGRDARRRREVEQTCEGEENRNNEPESLELPNWVKVKCLQLGDTSFTMASRFMAQGQNNRRTSRFVGRSVSARKAKRTSLAVAEKTKAKNNSKTSHAFRQSYGTEGMRVDEAVDMLRKRQSRTQDNCVPEGLRPLAARRATTRPDIAFAALRGDASRRAAIQVFDRQTSSDSDAPSLLSHLSEEQGSARGTMSSIAGTRRRMENIEPADDVPRRSPEETNRCHVSVEEVLRLSPLKSLRAGSTDSDVNSRRDTIVNRTEPLRPPSIANPSVKIIMSMLKQRVSIGSDDALNAGKNVAGHDCHDGDIKDDDEEDVDEDVKYLENLRCLAEEAKKSIVERGLSTYRDASNYDFKKGKLKHEGSVKAAAVMKNFDGIVCLFKKPSTHLPFEMKALVDEIKMTKTIVTYGVRMPVPLTDAFHFRVNGTKTFGYLVERVCTTMSAPYKPQAHKSTWQGFSACLRGLSYQEQKRALSSLEVIRVFNRHNHYLHDMQLLVQNNSPHSFLNGHIYVIDPGKLQAPKKNGWNQTRRACRGLKKIMGIKISE